MAGELVIMTSFSILFIFMADLSLAANETADAEPYRCRICNEANCFAGFVKLGDYCYFFSNAPDDWDNAHKSCKEKGADLAHPMNEKESSLITKHMEMLIRTKFPDSHGFYLGGNYKQERRQWVWSFNNKPMGFTNWIKGYPWTDSSDRCVFSYKRDEYKWRNVHCPDPHLYVCQQ